MTDDQRQDGDNPSGRQRSARHRERPTTEAPSGPKPGVFATALGDIQRLREIASVLARHGFHQIIRSTGLEKFLGDRFAPPQNADPVDPSDPGATAKRLRQALEELGATFIKLGQILSTRPDLLPQTYIKEFEKLQDKVEPLGFDQVRAQIERALGDSLESLYADVDPKPLATASIGQVHEALTRQGRKVVVKVLRPGVITQIRADLDILYFLSRILQATIAETDIYNVTEIVREFDRAISQEVDFRIEARNLRRFADHCADNPHVIIPEVIEELSCESVLTLEFIEGRKLSAVPPGSDEALRLIEILRDSAYDQIFTHGFFHGDPHPGNILVTGPEQIALLDLGLVGQLSRAQQDDLVTLVLTILNGDVDGIARTVLRMGQPQGRVSLGEFKREISRLRNQYLNRHLDDIDFSAFTMDLMDAALRYRIKLNSEYSVLAKATVTVEGILRKLHPDLDLLETAQPIARRLLMERYNTKRLMQTVFTGAVSLSSFLRDVPAQLDQVLMDIESGTITVNVQNQQMDRMGSDMSTLGTRLFMGLLCCGLIVGGSVLIGQLDHQPGDITMLGFVAAGMLVTAALIAFWTLAWPVVRPRLGRVRLAPVISLIKRFF